jgi:two-component system chemotaxis response regulator CheB
MIKALNPDVLTLDVEMPRMDGLAFLEKIMALRPMPVIMVSTMTGKGTQTTLRALELGAVDFLAKPNGDLRDGLETFADELIPKIKAAALSKVQAQGHQSPVAPGSAVSSGRGHGPGGIAIAIGASTGGVVALRTVLGSLPDDAPPVLVTQHMPPRYTKPFAERLNEICAMTVQEAQDGQEILPGHVYVADGGQQLELRRVQAKYRCRVFSGPPVSGHCPSVDVLFSSFAEQVGPRGVGVILTGMGRDGAVGLLQMRRSGAITIGQNQASCVVYGMPRAAMELGGVGAELTLNQIPAAILQACTQRAA